MRYLPIFVLLAAATTAAADPAKPCDRAGNHVAELTALAKPAEVRVAVARRCEKDHWSRELEACFVAAPTGAVAERCLDQLGKDQRKLLESDAEHIGDVGFLSWTMRRPLLVQTAAARALHEQGLAEYREGHYRFAIRKLTAAYETQPSAELIYHMAQSYKRSGQWGQALELYEKYLDVAPEGPAANDCRAQIEKLREQLP